LKVFSLLPFAIPWTAPPGAAAESPHPQLRPYRVVSVHRLTY